MDKLEFRLNISKGFYGTSESVSILINNINLMDIIRYKDDNKRKDSFNQFSELGLRDICNALFYRDKEYWFEDDLFSVLGCCCGEKDCGPFRVRIIEMENSIIWTDFDSRNTIINKNIIKFEFEKNQYLEQVKYLSDLLKSDY